MWMTVMSCAALEGHPIRRHARTAKPHTPANYGLPANGTRLGNLLLPIGFVLNVPFLIFHLSCLLSQGTVRTLSFATIVRNSKALLRLWRHHNIIVMESTDGGGFRPLQLMSFEPTCSLFGFAIGRKKGEQKR